MNKLAKILQLAEYFYTGAMKALAAETYVMPDDPEEEDDLNDPGGDLLEQLDAMRKKIVNKDLAKQLVQFISSYISYTDALNAPAPSSEDEETFAEIEDTLQTRWKRLVENPYLNLDEDNPSYKEIFPPHEIVSLIEAVVDDANKAKERKAEEMGFTAEEMAQAEQAVQQEMFQSQVTKDVLNKLDENQQQQYANKVKRQLDAQRKFRDKLKTIRKLGPDNLKQVREDLEKAIAATTDSIAKKELEQRLKDTPDPRHLEVAQTARKRRHEVMINDATRKAAHDESLKKRQALIRDNDAKRISLINQYQQATSPADKQRLMNEMIRLESSVLERLQINLDDEFVRNDPIIANMLNPTEIVKRHLERFEKQKQHRTKEVSKRQIQRSEGQIVGLVLKVTQKLSDLINDLKKSLKKRITSQGFNDPYFAPYLKALSEAATAAQSDPSAKSGLEAAQEAINQAVKAYVDQHPTVAECNKKLEPWVKLKGDLQEVSSSKRKTSTPKNPWFYAEVIPEQYKPVITDLISRCTQASIALQGASPVTSSLFAEIAEQLKGKL